MVLAVVVALAATACSSPASPAPQAASGRSSGAGGGATGPSQGADPPAPTAPPTTEAPTTTTIPPLPTPVPITPLASPPLAGEGTWTPVGDRLARGYAIYSTVLRPAPGYPEAALAWIDSSATNLVLYAGTAEPYGTWPHQGTVEAAARPFLLAAFNSGFRIYDYRTGWYENGVSAETLTAGAASLAIFPDGHATVGVWGSEIGPASGAVAVRQNQSMLIDNGVISPAVDVPSEWGAVLGGGTFTWRSGIGVTAAGDLVYAGGPSLTPRLLADLLAAAGAVRAMQLDINPMWVSFVSYTHPAGLGTAGITGSNLLPGMYFGPDHYLTADSRDFLAVFAK